MSTENMTDNTAADVANLNVNSGQTLPEIRKNKTGSDAGEAGGEEVVSSVGINMSD